MTSRLDTHLAVEHRDGVPQLVVALFLTHLQSSLTQRVRENQHPVRSTLDETTLRLLDAHRCVERSLASRTNHTGVCHGVVLCGLLHDVSRVTRNDQQAIARVTEPERAIAGGENVGFGLDRRHETVVGQITHQWNDLHVSDALNAARRAAVQHVSHANRLLSITKYHASPPRCVAHHADRQ